MSPAGDMLFRNHQKCRRLWLDVVKRQNLFILINLVRGIFPSTILQKHNPTFRYILSLFKSLVLTTVRRFWEPQLPSRPLRYPLACHGRIGSAAAVAVTVLAVRARICGVCALLIAGRHEAAEGYRFRILHKCPHNYNRVVGAISRRRTHGTYAAPVSPVEHGSGNPTRQRFHVFKQPSTLTPPSLH